MDKSTSNYNTQGFPNPDEYVKTIKDPESLEQNKSLISYDIIMNDDPCILIAKQKVKGEIKFENQIESKSFAAFCGVAIGDSLGCFLEYVQINYERNYVKGFSNVESAFEKGDAKDIRCKKGQFTDDTGLSLCIADSILISNKKFDGKDLRHRFHHWWFSSYNNGKQHDQEGENWKSFGIGGSLRKSAIGFVKDQSDRVPGCDGVGTNRGNGSVMRLVSIPIAFRDDLKACLHYAKEQSYCTHNGEEASECSRLLCYVAWHLLNSETQEKGREFLDNIGKDFKSHFHGVQCIAESKVEDESRLGDYDPTENETIKDRTWTWKEANYQHSPKRTELRGKLCGIYCMDATAMSLHILYHTKSWKEAVLKAVNLGGDADTVAAITGMLAGFLYGWNEYLQSEYLEYVSQWDDFKCAIRASKLYQLNKQ